MRPTRWFNQTLPQTLQIAVFLLYFTGAFGLLGRMHVTNSYTPYLLLGIKLFNTTSGLATLLEFAASVGFIVAGLFLANERKQAWVAAVGLAGGAVVIPFAVSGLSFLSSDYLITWIFDAALLALLLHPMSRNHQRVWFS